MSWKGAIMECFQLDTKRKWEYLQHFYKAARLFYQYQEDAVSSEEINQAIQDFKEKPEPVVRKSIQLKDWKFRHDPDDQGLREGYFSNRYDEVGWDAVQLPHSTRTVPEKPIRYGKDFHDLFQSGEESTIWYATSDNWYRTQAAVGSIQENEIAFLRFESVNLLSDVWVNDNPVMVQHLGLFPFEIDVTEEVKDTPSAQVGFSVRARNIVSNKPWMFYNGFQLSYYMPPQTTGNLGEDWKDQPWTGIAGDVVLDVLNRIHLQDTFLITENIASGRAAINCRINLRNTDWGRFQGRVRVEISPWLPLEGPVCSQVSSAVEVLPMNHTRLDLRFAVDNPALWSPARPNLYLAHILLEDESGTPIDDLYETFGIRTIQVIGNSYYLNNEKLYVRGTHDVCHFFEESMICPSDAMIVKDILLHKKMGANCSRFPSDLRIHYKRIADYCDQIGYMLAWAGFFEVWKAHPEMEMYARRDVGAMVRSLRGCPSIIIWEMGDEPLLGIKDYRRYQWYELVYELVKAEDETRPILPAGHFSGELLDLYKKRKDGKLTPEEIRHKILEDYPIYGLEKAYWDVHTTFMLFPLRPFHDTIADIKEAFGGERLTILTEFGLDALPEPSHVLDIYGKFRWGANPYWWRNREEDDCAYYGKIISLDDWKETQAAQSVALQSAIVSLRENPDFFAGFYFMCMFDIWTYMQGVTDEKGRPKLGYYVARSLCQPVLLTALHGNVVHLSGTPIMITASNLEEPLQNATLRVRLLSSDGQVVKEQEISHLHLEGSGCVSQLGSLETRGLRPSLYCAELTLYSQQDVEVARSLELFYLEEQRAEEQPVK